MEYSQWMAFERAYGPLRSEWSDDALASIHEQLQQIAYLMGQAHFTDKTHKRGPVPKPERYPRPNESLSKPVSLVDGIDEDEEEWLPLTEDELVEVHIDPAESGEEG